MFKLKRYAQNPILTPKKEHSWESRSVYNPAAVLKDGKVYLLYRATGRDKIDGIPISRLGLCVLKNDGVTIEKRYPFPVYEPKGRYEPAGCEDPRVTKIEGSYYMLYTAYWGNRVPALYKGEEVNIAMAETKDFLRWQRYGLILPSVQESEKNGVLFPKKINGVYVLYYRVYPDIWVAYSESLKEPLWRKSKVVASPRKGYFDEYKIGAGAPPIETKDGWLFIYHGIDKNPAEYPKQFQYRVGVMLIDKENPEKVLYRSQEPILEPVEEYERKGEVPRVVFPCGAVVIKGTLFVYYGGADTVVGVATCKLSKLLNSIKEGTV